MTMHLQVIEGDRASLEERTLESILEGDYATSDRLMQSLNTRAILKIVPNPKSPILKHGDHCYVD